MGASPEPVFRPDVPAPGTCDCELTWRDFQPVKAAMQHVLHMIGRTAWGCCKEPEMRTMEGFQYIRGHAVYTWFENGLWCGQIVGREKVWYAATEADVDRLIAEQVANPERRQNR